MNPSTLAFLGTGEEDKEPTQVLPPGGYRWAVFDRKTRTLYVGPADIHTHMGVAELSGVLRNPPEYYQPKGNILGGYLCRDAEGVFFYDPYSGTFPGSNEGVREAETSLEEICLRQNLSFRLFKNIKQRLALPP